MLILLLIYVLGVIATLWIWYHNLNNGTEVTLFELSGTIALSTFSWITFVVIMLVIYGNKTVFIKK